MVGGGVIVEGKFAEDSGIPNKVDGSYEYNVSEIRRETVVYCGYLVKQWGHFLVDAITRLWYFLENYTSVDRYVFISEDNGNTQPTGNYKKFFELLGVYDKLEILNHPVRFEKVIVPECALVGKLDGYYSAQYRNILDIVADRSMELCAGMKTKKKIFLSRSRFKKATDSEFGLDMLDDYFSRNGYELLYPEQFSIAELIYFIRTSEMCATVSGSLALNFLFAQNGQSVTVVERQSLPHYSQNIIDVMRDLRTTYIDGYYTIYPGTAGGGPFLFGYTKQFAHYSELYGNVPPQDVYLSDAYLGKCLRRFMKVYRSFYGYKWGIEDWAVSLFAEAVYESYADSCSELDVFFSEKKIFEPRQFFSIRFAKQTAKKLLTKLGVLH